jgi:hypothetical protein
MGLAARIEALSLLRRKPALRAEFNNGRIVLASYDDKYDLFNNGRSRIGRRTSHVVLAFIF